MLSLTHNFASLSRVLPMINEELSVACERVILEEIIIFLGEIASYIKCQ